MRYTWRRDIYGEWIQKNRCNEDIHREMKYTEIGYIRKGNIYGEKTNREETHRMGIYMDRGHSRRRNILVRDTYREGTYESRTNMERVYITE